MLRHTAASPPSARRPSGPRWLPIAGSLAAAALFALLSVQALPLASAPEPKASAAMVTCPPAGPQPAGCCPPYYPPDCCPNYAPPNHCCGTKFNPSGDPADCCDPLNPVFDLKACLCHQQPGPLCDVLPPVPPAPAAPPAASVTHRPAARPPPADAA